MISLDELVVKDVMSTDPVCLHRETSVAEAIQVLVGRGVQGAPVVDEEGDLLGVVSTSDLLAALAPAYRTGEPLDVQALHGVKLQHVHDLLEGPPITVEEELAVGAACQLMVKERVHRLVVTREHRPVGMFSAIDLVRVTACLAAKP
ncbi:MAG: CBS domain-containing protein [Planctomycetes bacterium]|nr:CBS domain-containing protein [Planctomycetota bacterium]